MERHAYWHKRRYGKRAGWHHAIQFADRFDINISEAVAAKIAKLDEKYPVEIFEIKDKVEQNRRLLEAKKNYKKDTTL